MSKGLEGFKSLGIDALLNRIYQNHSILKKAEHEALREQVHQELKPMLVDYLQNVVEPVLKSHFEEVQESGEQSQKRLGYKKAREQREQLEKRLGGTKKDKQLVIMASGYKELRDKRPEGLEFTGVLSLLDYAICCLLDHESGSPKFRLTRKGYSDVFKRLRGEEKLELVDIFKKHQNDISEIKDTVARERFIEQLFEALE